MDFELSLYPLDTPLIWPLIVRTTANAGQSSCPVLLPIQLKKPREADRRLAPGQPSHEKTDKQLHHQCQPFHDVAVSLIAS